MKTLFRMFSVNFHFISGIECCVKIVASAQCIESLAVTHPSVNVDAYYLVEQLLHANGNEHQELNACGDKTVVSNVSVICSNNAHKGCYVYCETYSL